jgi:iron complex outermembrane receptor protein
MPLTVLPEQQQRTDSVYAELGLPLLAGSEGTAYKLLESKLSLRRDWYRTDTALYEPSKGEGSPDPALSSSHFGATSWMTSVRFQPLDFMFLRGHCGTGFLPPAVSDLTRPTQQIIESSGIVDPTRGDEPVGVVRVTAGGNPALVPERSRACGAGVVFGSQTERGMRLSVDYSRIVKHLGILSPVDWLFSDPKAFIRELPWRVARDDSGRISAIDASSLNTTRTEVRAWELGFGYTSRATRFGTLRFSTLATLQPTLLSQITSTSEVLNQAGIGLGPSRYKVASSLSVEHGPWAFGWTGRFVPRYKVSRVPAIVANQGNQFVASQQYHDVFASYSLPRMQWSADVKLQLGARNVFHQDPPFDAGALRLYSRYGEREIPSYYLLMRADF